jgi:hypothetical protein
MVRELRGVAEAQRNVDELGSRSQGVAPDSSTLSRVVSRRRPAHDGAAAPLYYPASDAAAATSSPSGPTLA